MIGSHCLRLFKFLFLFSFTVYAQLGDPWEANDPVVSREVKSISLIKGKPYFIEVRNKYTGFGHSVTLLVIWKNSPAEKPVEIDLSEGSSCGEDGEVCYQFLPIKDIGWAMEAIGVSTQFRQAGDTLYFQIPDIYEAHGDEGRPPIELILTFDSKGFPKMSLLK